MSDLQDQQTTDADFADRSYRSVPGMVAGVLLIALTLWLCVDAMVSGAGRTPWYALATLVLVVPVVTAFTLWPCVRANRDRLYVRNPFRSITAPWGEVESIHAALSVELRAGGGKYQVWAIPVSLRQRKRAGRRSMIAKGDEALQDSRATRTGFGGAPGSRFQVGGPGLRGRAGAGFGAGVAGGADAPATAWADRAVAELRQLAEAAEGRPAATGAVSVAWTWWVIAPAVAGALAIAILAVTG